MDYYEELGIDRTATEEEIGRAHRRLTRLLHPDQQTEEAMKQLAETQMRRLNSIVETLSDRQRRQDYDDELRHGTPGFQAAKLRRRAFHSWPWWVGSTVGAVVLTVGAVWLSADKWGSSFGDHTPTYIPSGAETGPEPNRTSSLTEAPPSPAPARGQGPRVSAGTDNAKTPVTVTGDTPVLNKPSRTVASVPAPGARGQSADRNENLGPNKVQADRSKPPVAVAEIPHHKTLTLPLTHASAPPATPTVNLPAAPALSVPGPGHMEAVSLPSGNLPAAPKLPEPVESTKVSYTAASAKATSPVQPQDLLEGEWVYAPTEPEKRKAGFYPPEYIDLRIWNEGGLRGEYRARYHVPDKPIPPDVSFALAPDGSPRHFSWASSNGSKGTLNISSVDAGSIRIEWRTTVFSRAPSLTAGTATLVRRTP